MVFEYCFRYCSLPILNYRRFSVTFLCLTTYNFLMFTFVIFRHLLYALQEGSKKWDETEKHYDINAKY